MRPARLVCAVAGVLAVTACGTSNAARGDRETVLAGAELDLLTRSGTFVRTSTVLANAESERIAACMKGKGFRYRADVVTAGTGTDEQRTIDMKDRRTRGYGLMAQYGTDRKESTGANDAYVAALSERESAAYMKALRGDDTDFREMRFGGGQNVTFSERGCEAESRKSLYGSLDEWISVAYFPQNLNSGLTARVEKSAEYRKAMNAWKECMRGRGHSYTSPDDAYARLKTEYRTRGAGQALFRREIAVATADGECAAEQHVPSTVLSLRRGYAQSLPETDKLRLRHLTTVWRGAADRAG